MKPTIITVVIIAALYVILILAPAVLFYKIIFSRHWYKGDSFKKINKSNAYYPAFADRFGAAADFICNLPKEDFEVFADDGTRICGTVYGEKSDKTALFLHGYNTPPLNNFCLQAKVLYECGFSIVFIYQRSHGESGGTSTMGIKESEDLLGIIPFIKEKTGAKKILIYGMSMGCTALAYASDKLDSSVKGIVLDCGFTSPYSQLRREMTRRHLPAFLISPLLVCFTKTFKKIDIKRSVTDSLKSCKTPTLFFHGGADITVPQIEGNEIFNSCAAEKMRYSAPGAVHTLCFPAGGDKTEKMLSDFAKKYFK